MIAIMVPIVFQIVMCLCDSVMVYTASGLSPILPAASEDGDSESEVGDGFDSSTWVSKHNADYCD